MPPDAYQVDHCAISLTVEVEMNPSPTVEQLVQRYAQCSTYVDSVQGFTAFREHDAFGFQDVRLMSREVRRRTHFARGRGFRIDDAQYLDTDCIHSRVLVTSGQRTRIWDVLNSRIMWEGDPLIPISSGVGIVPRLLVGQADRVFCKGDSVMAFGSSSVLGIPCHVLRVVPRVGFPWNVYVSEGGGAIRRVETTMTLPAKPVEEAITPGTDWRLTSETTESFLEVEFDGDILDEALRFEPPR